jgi:23S rRNA (guanosine2251-2'-O)-methyltransferase
MVEGKIKDGDRALESSRPPRDRRQGRPEPGRTQRPRPKPNATPDDLAFGINACAMALAGGFARAVEYDRETGNPRVRALVDEARRLGVNVREAPLARLDELTAGGVHQGILVRLRDLPEIDLRAAARGVDRGLVVLLDHVTDPQNLGAVLRTAVAVGVTAVVIPRRRGVQLTPGVHRASAGMSFVAPVAAPQNLALAVVHLKEAGFWVVAADQSGESADATAFDWPAKTALILGSEGEGVSQLLLRESDFRVALPMDPRVESLNVGVAFGALAYLWRRQFSS